MNKKVSGWLVFSIIVIIGVTCLTIYRSPNSLWRSTDKPKNTDVTPVTRASGWTYVTNTIVLTERFSPSVHINNTQTIAYLIVEGYASEYEVRDEQYPNEPRKFGHGRLLTSDQAPIYNWQWRVSGTMHRGPVMLRYIIGTPG